MTYRGEPIVSYFHSTCGGKTIDDKFVFKGRDLPYIQSVYSPYGDKSPHWKWSTELPMYEISKYIRRKYKNIGRVEKIAFKKVEGRVSAVRITHRNGILELSGNSFRLLFPVKKVKSTYFSAQRSDNGLKLFGKGWGHGVGLCQWSSKGMAERGAHYKAILRYFYKNIRIKRL